MINWFYLKSRLIIQSFLHIFNLLIGPIFDYWWIIYLLKSRKQKFSVVLYIMIKLFQWFFLLNHVIFMFAKYLFRCVRQLPLIQLNQFLNRIKSMNLFIINFLEFIDQTLTFLLLTFQMFLHNIKQIE